MSADITPSSDKMESQNDKVTKVEEVRLQSIPEISFSEVFFLPAENKH